MEGEGVEASADPHLPRDYFFPPSSKSLDTRRFIEFQWNTRTIIWISNRREDTSDEREFSTIFDSVWPMIFGRGKSLEFWILLISGSCYMEKYYMEIWIGENGC